MVATGWTLKLAASAIGINYDYAKEILHNYNKQGVAAIPNRRKTLRRNSSSALLNAEALSKLRRALKSRPADGGIWTLVVRSTFPTYNLFSPQLPHSYMRLLGFTLCPNVYTQVDRLVTKLHQLIKIAGG